MKEYAETENFERDEIWLVENTDLSEGSKSLLRLPQRSWDFKR